jgi:hypothetical protein
MSDLINFLCCISSSSHSSSSTNRSSRNGSNSSSSSSSSISSTCNITEISRPISQLHTHPVTLSTQLLTVFSVQFIVSSVQHANVTVLLFSTVTVVHIMYTHHVSLLSVQLTVSVVL